MILLKVEDVKSFMNNLLREDTFDNFDVRTVDIVSFAAFHVDGLIVKEQTEDIAKTQEYTKWKHLKSYAFNMIKGNTKPKQMKFIFSYDREKTERYENAKVLYLNIIFKDETLTITTGMQQKEFSLDKKSEIEWDNAVHKFLNEKGIKLAEESSANAGTVIR